MGRPYQVVVSPGIDFFLKAREVLELAEREDSWALEVCKNDIQREDIFIPSQEELPRHSKALIATAENIERFDIVDLEVKSWPPKYFVISTEIMGGEKVFEPGTTPWRTVFYPEDYNAQPSMTEEDRMWSRINSIAP